jgi:WD40 repeat protein
MKIRLLMTTVLLLFLSFSSHAYIETPTTILEYGTALQAISWSPDGTALAIATRNGEIKVYNLEEQSNISLDLEISLYTISWSPNGEYLAVGDETGEVQVFTLDDSALEPYREMPAHFSQVNFISWSPDSSRLVSVGNDINIFVWELEENIAYYWASSHLYYVTCVDWSPDGSSVATGGGGHIYADYSVIVRSAREADVDEPELGLLGHTQDVWSVTWSPDGNYLASGGQDGMVFIWDMDTVEMFTNFPVSETAVLTVDWYSEAGLLAAGDANGQVTVWDALDFQGVTVLQAHNDAVTQVAWMPNNKILATASLDGTVQIWDLNEE